MAIRGAGLKTGQLISHLMVRGVAQAIGFYERALGAKRGAKIVGAGLAMNSWGVLSHMVVGLGDVGIGQIPNQGISTS